MHFRGLEPGCIAFCAFGFSPDFDLPEITGARFKLNWWPVGQAVDVGAINLAAIKNQLLEVVIKADHHLSSSLHLIVSILNHPGKSWFFYSKSKGVHDMVGFEMGYFHVLP